MLSFPPFKLSVCSTWGQFSTSFSKESTVFYLGRSGRRFVLLHRNSELMFMVSARVLNLHDFKTGINVDDKKKKNLNIINNCSGDFSDFR